MNKNNLQITVNFRDDMSPATHEHKRQVLKSYLESKGVSMSADDSLWLEV